MREVLEDFRNVRQKADDVEEEYCKRLNEAISGSWNVHDDDKKKHTTLTGCLKPFVWYSLVTLRVCIVVI